jgi:hypothetical protein
MINSRLTYALAVLLCGTLILSCLPPIESPPDEISSSDIAQTSSSSQIAQSSGNDTPEYNYCVFDADKSCLPGAQITTCPPGGTLSNNCPYSSSSTQQPPPPPPPGSSSSSYVIQLPSSSSVSAPSSSSSKPAQTVSGCKENNPKAGFTCGWNGYTATATLTPGTMLKPAAFTLPSGCSSVAWKFAPDTSDMTLLYGCEATDESGFAALGSRTYVLFAELTCDDGKHTNACNPAKGWSSKIAPVLTGECKWAKNPTTTARGAVPSGVSVIDVDHVCTSPTVVYKYDDGTQTWPSTGILPEWKDWDKKHETYDVEATLNCPAYPQTITTACPPLEVTAGSDYIIECTGGYEYTYCGGTSKTTVNLKADECVEINVLGYTNSLYLPSLLMRCDTQGNQASVSVTLALNGKAQTFTGSWVWNGQIDLGKVKVGDNEFGTLCVTALSGATSVRCNGPTQ